MAKFQIYQFMFRPINENQLELPFEEFHAINVQDSLKRKQDLLGSVLNDFAYEPKEHKRNFYTNTASMLTKITSIYCAWPIIRKQRLNQTSTLQN